MCGRYGGVRWYTRRGLGLLPLWLAVWVSAQSATLTPRSSRLPYDPICAVTNAGSIVALRPLPAGTRRMIERLAKIRDNADPDSMAYLNDRMIPNLRAQIARAPASKPPFHLRFQLGRQLVAAGRAEEGIAEFDSMEKEILSMGGRLDGKGAADMRISRAIAYLRLAEQENCLTNHNAKSCLFPIEAEGVHSIQRGARGAIAVLLEQLAADPNDLQARWLLNVASMTVGDWPSKVPTPWLIPPKAFQSEYDIKRFPDIAGDLGLDVDDLAGGCILEDFDNDDIVDIVVSSWSLDGPLRYFRNAGDGRFEERTAEAGLTGTVGGLNIQQTDYNNDGWADIWILRGAWLSTAGRIPNSLLRNNRDGTFTDVTEEAGLLSFHPTQASSWFDYDGDGWLDVFIGNESWGNRDRDWSELFHNNRDGTFTEVARESGLAIARFIKGVTTGDYDNDGRPDLFLSCRDGANLLCRNEGAAGTNAAGRAVWRFRNTSAIAGVNEAVQSFPTWFFDYDNDGHEDLFVSGYLTRGVGDVAADYLGLPHSAALPRLYRNLGNGSFSNITEQVGLNRLCHTMGCNFGDLDNDGWLDFYLGTGDPDLATLIPNRMFRNDGGKRFQEVTSSGGFGHLQKGHGVGFADLDHDGDQDIYAVIGGAFVGDHYRNALYENPGHGNRWIKLHCVGERSNRAAIGTRIRVTVQTPDGPRNIHRTVNSGGSFGSSPFRQEIGLGNATAILELELFWPATGVRQTLKSLELDHAYRIQEGADRAEALVLPPIRFEKQVPAAHAHGLSMMKN